MVSGLERERMEERDGKREYVLPPVYLWIIYLTHSESQFPRHKDTSFRGWFGGLNEIMHAKCQRISCHIVVLSAWLWLLQGGSRACGLWSQTVLG